MHDLLNPYRSGFFSMLAVLVLLASGFSGAAQHGPATQQPAPTRPKYKVATVAPNVTFQDRIPPEQLKFLKDYPGHPEMKLFKDKQFNALVKLVIPRTGFNYGDDFSLADTVDIMLHAGPAVVSVLKNRYVMVATSEGPYRQGRAFLWVDAEQGIALGGIFFDPTNGEPAPTLTIFSNQLRVSELKMSQLPAPFQDDLHLWSTQLNLPAITTRYFIPKSGRKYLLEHDEDLCNGVRRVVITDEACKKRKLDAAEIDVEAAAFMYRAHNAADATAWNLNSLDVEQGAWEQQRQKLCGMAYENLECWLRVTRQRTQAIIAKQKQ